jgi:predicted GIY-YIG superfamily endonuclease
MNDVFYVYILRSSANPEKVYVGFTNDLERRIREHNSGSQIYTRRYAPWALETYLTFSDRATATAFEKYLKSQSGRAFLHKRLLNRSISTDEGKSEARP